MRRRQFCALLPYLVGIAFSGPALAETWWQEVLTDQMLEDYQCKVVFFTNVVERDVNGELTVFARVHCDDKRSFDAVLDDAQSEFQIKECEKVATC